MEASSLSRTGDLSGRILALAFAGILVEVLPENGENAVEGGSGAFAA